MDFGTVSRRQLFGAGIGLGMASAVGPAFGASPALAQASSSASPALVHRRELLMRGLLRQGLQVSSLKGIFYAVEGGSTTPLHGGVMSSFTKHTPMPDGSIRTRTIEIEWYTDLNGVIFDHWTNPITGKTVPQPPRKYFVNTITTGPNLERGSPTLGKRYQEWVQGWREDGDDVWMFNHLSTLPAPAGSTLEDLPTGPANKPVATELGTYHARRSELDAPGVTNVRIESYHTCEGGYRAWQQMGNTPGNLLLLCYNHSLDSRDQLPPEWLAETEKHFPELLRDPEALLDA
jgi:hypothetical protein